MVLLVLAEVAAGAVEEPNVELPQLNNRMRAVGVIEAVAEAVAPVVVEEVVEPLSTELRSPNRS